jgi:hypothetical protein
MQNRVHVNAQDAKLLILIKLAERMADSVTPPVPVNPLF